MESPAIHHTSSPDGTRLAFWSLGRGRPLLYIGVPCCSHVQAETKVAPLLEWYHRLAQNFQLVRLDLRGYGGSQRDGVELTLTRLQEDVLAVADALELPQFSIFTHGGSAATALSLASRSDRVRGLVVFDGWADGVNLDVHKSMTATLQLARDRFDVFSSFVARAVLQAPGKVASEIDDLLRKSATAAQWERFTALQVSTDVTALLSSIRCPTLVIHSGDGMITGHGEESLAIARAIPGAQFAAYEFPSFPMGDTTGIFSAMVDFLRPENVEHHVPAGVISAREAEVLELLALGRTNRQIADELVISQQTVARHVHNLLSKLDVSNRTEAAAWAARRRKS